MRSFPNMTVIVPGDYEEARLATRAAAEHVGPVYLRFGRDSYPVIEQIHAGFCIGKAKMVREGSDLTIISTGIMVSEALLAAEELLNSGISARVIHMPTIKPLDVEIVMQAAKQTRGIVTAEEHSILGGLGEAVAGVVGESYPVPIRRVGIRDTFGESGTASELLTRYGLRAKDIVQAANAVCAGQICEQ
jgi:transketolase